MLCRRNIPQGWLAHPQLQKRTHAPASGRGRLQAAIRRAFVGRPSEAEMLTRTKIVMFHVLMWALIAPPLLAASALLITSMIGYDILQHPERHRSTGRMWNVIATDLYYLYEADLWQNKKECVQYDDKLLYKPSSGCRFSNKEFSTYLTFSEAGVGAVLTLT
jgi:hypothetical protein